MYRFLDRLIFILTISCDQATRLMSDSMERQLSIVERLALIGHMASCKTGRRFRRQLNSMRDQLHAGTDPSGDVMIGEGRAESSALRLSVQARNRIRVELERACQSDS